MPGFESFRRAVRRRAAATEERGPWRFGPPWPPTDEQHQRADRAHRALAARLLRR